MCWIVGRKFPFIKLRRVKITKCGFREWFYVLVTPINKQYSKNKEEKKIAQWCNECRVAFRHWNEPQPRWTEISSIWKLKSKMWLFALIYPIYYYKIESYVGRKGVNELDIVAVNHGCMFPFAHFKWMFLIGKRHKTPKRKERKTSSLIYLCIKIYCRKFLSFQGKSIITQYARRCVRLHHTQPNQFEARAIWTRRRAGACVGVFIRLFSIDRKWSGVCNYKTEHGRDANGIQVCVE